MLLHEKITVIRKMYDLTQEAFAESLGVSRQAVSKWENGNAKPDIDMLVRIADDYDVPLEHLVRDDYDLTIGQSTAENIHLLDNTVQTFDIASYLGKICDVTMNSLLFGVLRHIKIVGMTKNLICFEKNNRYGYFNYQKSLAILVKGEETYEKHESVDCGKCRVYVNKGTYFGGQTYLFSAIESVSDHSITIRTGEFVSEVSYEDISVIQMKEKKNS